MRPVSPLAGYIGGKRNLAGRLVPLLESIPHRAYAEPFVGMGGVFLRRTRRPPVEVINDRSEDVSNLFRILQRHYVSFLEELRFRITSRAQYEALAAAEPRSLTDLERAARFLYLQKLSFGGKVASQTFGVSPSIRFDITKLGPLLEALHERLAGVVVECLDFRDFLPRYDREGVLFYLDPPYHGSEASYGRELFRRADFEVLAGLLAALRGRFVLSLNDVPEVREAFGAFAMAPIATTYTVGGGERAKTAGELVITNYPPCLEVLRDAAA